MRFLILSVAVGFFAAVAFSSSAMAGTLVQLNIKKNSDKEKPNAAGRSGMAKGSTNVTYDVSVTSTAPADLSDLTLEYLVFVERQRIGEKKGTEVEVRVPGSESIPALTRKAPVKITTKPIALNVENVVGASYFVNGGRVKAEDSIKGVWIRVKQGSDIVGEYVNPSTVKNRGWDPSEAKK